MNFVMNRLKRVDRTTWNNLITYAIVIAAFIAVQIMMGMGMISNSLQGQLVPICAYIIMAVSLNLIVGISGELSLGHAGFMSVGAFTGAVFTICMEGVIPASGLRFALSIVCGTVMAGIFGAVIGIPVLRLRGDYLAIVTLAFGEIIKSLLNALYLGVDSSGIHMTLADSSTELKLDEAGEVIIKGAQGIVGTPRDASFVWGFVLVMIALVVVLNIIKSRTGRAIMAARDNRIAAESVGIDVTKYKMIAFVVGAALAGTAGVLYAHNYSTLNASKFDYNMSIQVLVFVVLGGIGSIRGSVIAAAILVVLPELLRGFDDMRMLIYALVLIVMMIFTQGPKIVRWREAVITPKLAGLRRAPRGRQPQAAEKGKGE